MPRRQSGVVRFSEADYADLRARGVDVDAKVIGMGKFVPPMFLFRNPDGNWLVIVERDQPGWQAKKSS